VQNYEILTTMPDDLVLLTGATGFVGIRILAQALQAGYRVRCAVRTPDGIKKILAAPSIKGLSITDDTLSWVIVPVISEPGAYDEAVRGVTYIIHCATPVPDIGGKPSSATDDDSEYTKPAVRGVIGMLDSAAKHAESTIRRVVVTSSIVAIIPSGHFFSPGPEVIGGENRLPDPTPPYEPPYGPYVASKTAAVNATDAWVADHEPPFGVVNIMPTWVCGPDEHAKTARDTLKGANAIILNLLRGEKAAYPTNTAFAHVDDVAKAHLLSLTADIKHYRSFIIGELEDLDSAREIARARFPRAFSDGVLRDDGKQPCVRILTNGDKAREELGFTKTPFEKVVEDCVAQYLELKREE
jgi:nucleoside-diphosphate-sugar epimerase